MRLSLGLAPVPPLVSAAAANGTGPRPSPSRQTCRLRPVTLFTYMTIACAPVWAFDVLTANNRSFETTCAEQDNINIPLVAKGAAYFQVRATHPKYPFVATPGCGADFSASLCCAFDFSGCPAVGTTSALLRTADLSCQKIFDDGVNAFNLCTEQSWWRPGAMTVTVHGAAFQGHRLVLNRKIADEASWPEVLVIYADGNVRLKAHPPAGVGDVCPGSSVIIGPAAADPLRPFIDITDIAIAPAQPCFHVRYAGGGMAHYCLAVDRQAAQLNVAPAYPSDRPVVTFRSMWVADGNADVDHLDFGSTSLPILSSWTAVGGAEWVFRRAVFSRHNTSAPDITIRATDVETTLMPRPWKRLPGL